MADFDIESLEAGLRAGERAALGRAITLFESRNKSHRKKADALLSRLLPHSGKAIRLGISGVPGVGKSTFIEALGLFLIGLGHRVAVLAVDPSSSRSGGSILGDKTRMEKLAADAQAFIRPSPSAGVLGGVARATMEAIIAVEAAGYDVVLVETVGTGQSEVIVADMVDVFLLLALPGAGDDLQGIKKGILELVDIIAVNKADIFKEKRTSAVRDLRAALHIMQPRSENWRVPVLTTSGLTGEGLDTVWSKVLEHQDIAEKTSDKATRRTAQQLAWYRRLVQDQLSEALFEHVPEAKALAEELTQAIRAGEKAPGVAAAELLEAMLKPLKR